MGNIGIWQLLIIVVIVVLLFGRGERKTTLPKSSTCSWGMVVPPPVAVPSCSWLGTGEVALFWCNEAVASDLCDRGPVRCFQT